MKGQKVLTIILALVACAALVFGFVTNGQKADLQKVKDELTAQVETLKTQLTSAEEATKAAEAAQQVAEEATKAAEEAKTAAEEAAKKAADDAAVAIEEAKKAAEESAQKAIEEAKKAAEEAAQNVEEKAADVAEGAADAAGEAAETVGEAAAAVEEKAAEVVEEAAGAVEEAAAAVEEKAAEVVEEAAAAVEQVAAAVTEDGVMNHEAYMKAELDTAVTVETYVQDTQSWWDNKITVYGQSEDGAYFIYNMTCSEEDAKKLVPGTKIKVSGYKSEWAGEVEITDATFEILEADPFVAEPLDITAIIGTDDYILHQNERVCFTGKIAAYDDNGAAFAYKNENDKTDDLYFKVKVGEEFEVACTVEFYLRGQDSDVYKAVENLKVGDEVVLDGYLYWYEGANPHIIGVEVK